MSKRLNRCAICGKEYEVCSTCASIKSFTPWRTIVDNINCYGIHTALRDYTNGYINKEEAKRLLTEHDLSGVENFQENIKVAIANILNESDQKKKSKKNHINDNENIDENKIINDDNSNIEQ